MTPRWFITFPQRLSTRNCFRLIDAESEDEARALAFDHHGQAWAFVYSVDELDEQRERYGLVEITPAIEPDRRGTHKK